MYTISELIQAVMLVTMIFGAGYLLACVLDRR